MRKTAALTITTLAPVGVSASLRLRSGSGYPGQLPGRQPLPLRRKQLPLHAVPAGLEGRLGRTVQVLLGHVLVNDVAHALAAGLGRERQSEENWFGW